MAVDLSQVFTGKNGNLLPPFLWMVICLVLWVLANYIFAVISHLRASFPAVLLFSVRLMAGHIKETFILLFTMAGTCLIVFLVPGLFVLFPGILCGIASRWLVAEKYASIPAALIYLLAAALAFYASLRFTLPMYHNGARVYGTMSNVYAPLESCYLFVLLFGLTLARSITRHSREKE